MSQISYIKRLREDMSVWVERGWIVEGKDKNILEYAAAHGVRHSAAQGIAMLGALLLGTGVVLFFAANWGEMAKLTKLAVLFGGMWLAYVAAGRLLSDEHYPRIGQAVLLLAVIMFGANIMLIAQIYHIDAHYPNGVLTWSLGALMAAYLMRSQPAMAAAIALAIVWTSLESGFLNGAHWWFLPLWACFLPAVHRWHWRAAAHLALISLIYWSWDTFWSVSSQVFLDKENVRNLVFLAQIYFFAYLGLFILGMLMTTSERFRDFADLVQRYGAFASLSGLFALTFPDNVLFLSERGVAGTGWIGATLVVFAVTTRLAWYHRSRTLGTAIRARFMDWGWYLMGGLALLMLVNLFVSADYGGVIAVLFNLAFFTGLIWLMNAGQHAGNAFVVNLAFIFFALGILARYFDTFWSLMNRSLFFMVGGLLLLAGGYFLESRRRAMVSKIGRGESA